jgi:DNA (cytosine-5)-methyltransferase 1
MTRPVREDDRQAFELMTPTTLYSDLPEHLKRYRSDTFNDKYKRLAWDDLSRTITAHIAKDGYWYIHPAEHRTLTVREAARIQTFPDSFRFAGTRSDAFRQIGNAVPPLLGRVVAESIRPDATRRSAVSDLTVMRARLAAWAIEQRDTTWWLFPGPDMTAPAAAVAVVLEVHRLPSRVTATLMSPLRGVQALTLTAIEHIDAQTLSKTRAQAIRRLRESLLDSDPLDSNSRVVRLLGSAQRKAFSLLLGGNELIVNERIAKIVAMLMDLPEAQTGLHTDIKVALSQLVSSDTDAALRMSAIRSISVPEATARIKAIIKPSE